MTEYEKAVKAMVGSRLRQLSYGAHAKVEQSQTTQEVATFSPERREKQMRLKLTS